jgi:hypothetical protein
MHAPDGILFEYYDENMENPWTLSIEEFVDKLDQRDDLRMAAGSG